MELSLETGMSLLHLALCFHSLESNIKDIMVFRGAIIQTCDSVFHTAEDVPLKRKQKVTFLISSYIFAKLKIDGIAASLCVADLRGRKLNGGRRRESAQFTSCI